MKHIDKRLGYLQYLDVLLAAEHGPVHRELPKDVKKGKDFETCVFIYLSIDLN
jgi:splicing factor 3A subunit 3